MCIKIKKLWNHHHHHHHHHHQSVLPKGRSFNAGTGTKAAVLPKAGMNRCGSFPLLSAPILSLASEQTLKDLKNPSGTNVEVRRVDLANWALQTSPNFTIGVKYQFHQSFWPEQRSGNPNRPSPPMKTYLLEITEITKTDMDEYFIN